MPPRCAEAEECSLSLRQCFATYAAFPPRCPCCPARLTDKRLVPDAGITVEFGTQHSSGGGTGSAVYVSDAHGASSFDVQQRFKVAKGLALEVSLG